MSVFFQETYMVADSVLLRLASLFEPYSKLYSVGGCVRDGLLGLECHDTDICSALSAEEVTEILKGSEFTVQEHNMRMGTLIIVTHNFRSEYTAFRVDSYDRRSGNHNPAGVSFTKDIKEDALRRDFKCNALYYDILGDKIVDVLGGREDLENRILSTTDEPDKVFEADGLRILRLVRFSAELGFSIEKETFESAKRNAWRVKDLSVERIKDELDKIFTSDTKHKELQLSDAHLKGVRLLDELGLMEILLPEVNALKGLSQPPQYHLYDAYEHSLMTFAASAPEIRWAALYHDIGKKICMDLNANMHGHDAAGAEKAGEIASRFRFSNKERHKFIFLIKYHMADMNEKTRINKLRMFVVKNIKDMDDLVKIKHADCIGACGKDRRMRIEDVIDEVRRDGTPLSLQDLTVSGKDLVDLGVPEKMRGRLLNQLWDDTIINLSLNNRNSALNYINRRVKKL